MKLLLATGIYPPEIGGPATFVPAFAAECVRMGISVTVVTYGDANTERSPNWSVEKVSRAGGTLLRYVRYAWRTWRLARTVDVVFVQGPFSEGFPATIGAWLARRPTVLRVPGDFAWEGMQRRSPDANQSLEQFLQQAKPFPWKMIFALEAWVAQRAKAVITPSSYLQQLADAWGVPKNRQQVIYNTVELDRILPPREELRAASGVVAQTKILLVVARLAPWKRVDFLLEVLKELPAEYQLVVLGEGPELARLQALARSLAIEARVRFEGRVSRHRVQAWALAADAFLLPSLYEGFPHVAIEMACLGLPCFLSDKGGNAEAVSVYPKRMELLPYGDTAAWTRALRVLPERAERTDPRPFTEVAAAYLDVIKARV